MTPRNFAAAGAAAALLAFAIATPSFSQSSGGASNLQGGKGFGCAAGTTYQLVNGMARCTQPPPTRAAEAACSATVMTSGACSFSFPTSTSRSQPIAATSTAGYNGTASAACTAGTWSGISGASCTPNPCSAALHTYGACNFSVPALASGTASTMATTTAGYNGSSKATCSAGTLAYSGESCAAIPVNCGAGSIAWGASCSASVGYTVNGGTATLTNAVAGYTGSAQFTCNNGTWNGPYSSSCTANPPPTCSSPAPAGSQTLTCQAAGYATGYTGSVTQSRSTSCGSGTGWAWVVGGWSTVSDTCTPPPPSSPPSNALIDGGDSGCDDTYSKTMTGTYTATTTWFRSADGRGAHLGLFMTKRVQNWTFNGTSWVGQTPTTDTIVNMGSNPAHYCM